MARWKVAVTDWEYADLRYEEKVLGGGPFELIPAQCRTEEEVVAACRDADAILNQYAPLGRRVVKALNRCRVIVRYGVGVNTIDVAAATEKEICVANVPDYCFDEVSDHALTLLLNLARRITAADRLVKQCGTSRGPHRSAGCGQTVGLVGFGNIPRILAEKLKPLGFRLIAHQIRWDRPSLQHMGRCEGGKEGGFPPQAVNRHRNHVAGTAGAPSRARR